MATYTITFTYPTAQAQNLLDYFATAHRYQSTLSDGSSNPETKQQFLDRKVKEFIANSIKQAKAVADADAARAAAISTIDSTIPIT